MLSILVFILILSVLILVHELGHFIVAKKNGVLVEEFGFGLPPKLLSIKFGETLYSLNALPFGGFVKVLGEEEAELTKKKLPAHLARRTFVSKKPIVRVAIIAAGVVANFLLGWLIVSYLFIKGVPAPTDNVVVEAVADKSPAEKAGIKRGDILVSIARNSQNNPYLIKKTQDVVDLTNKYGGIKIDLLIRRDNKEINILATPRKNPPVGQGGLGLNVQQVFAEKKYPWYSAPFFGLIESLKISQFMVSEILKIIVKLVSFKKVAVDVAGPVGIAQITSKAVGTGLSAVLQLLGILSFNLAIINILPFPALDGGRLVFVIYEWISKKKVNATFERRVNFVGFALLITLIIVVTVNDIIRIIK